MDFFKGLIMNWHKTVPSTVLTLLLILITSATVRVIFLIMGMKIFVCCLYRTEKEWKELQTEVGELFEARP